MLKLASFLIENSVITSFEGEQVTHIAEQSHMPLARVILAEGYSSPLKLYEAIARYHKLSYANLEIFPSESSVVDQDLAQAYRQYHVIPWKRQGQVIVLATTEISDALKAWAQTQYGTDYTLVITSPHDLYLAYSRHFGEAYDHYAREHLYEKTPAFSAKTLFAKGMVKRLSGVACILFGLTLLEPLQFFGAFFVILNFFYATTLVLRLALILLGSVRRKADHYLHILHDFKDSELPVYTILVPLYQEQAVLKKLINGLRNIDYPAVKLDIKLIVEQDDSLTTEAIKALKCERMFEIIHVPYSLPRTKPKACNYALQYARGEYVVIYDAEDTPDPLQLKRALSMFGDAPDDVVCVQARLNFFNYNENTLTRMFAFEYANLFDSLLYGLQAINVPIPLGGTSNHFKTIKLKELYGWDPYNVTEDADLGIRLAQKGWKTRMLDSMTWEEAPLTFSIWLKQRTRWIKGHMQTYFVHMRHPLRLLRALGLRGFMGVQFVLGIPALIFLIAPLMWCVWLVLIVGGVELVSFMPLWFKPILYMSYGVLVFGVWAQIFLGWWAMQSHPQWKGMHSYTLLYPFYWFLHSAASFRAVWHLIKKPHHWEKTPHGVTKLSGLR